MANKFTPQSERPAFSQCEWVFSNGSLTLASAKILTVYRTRLKHDDDSRTRENIEDDRPKQFDPVDGTNASKTVNITGIGPTTYARIMEGFVKMLDAEKPA